MNYDELLFLLANSTPSAELSLFSMDAIDKLQAENAALRAKLDAVPVDALRYMIDPFANGGPTADAGAAAWAAIDAWMQTQQEAQA